MLTKALLDLVPNNGEIKIILTKKGEAARLSVIPSLNGLGEVKDNDELQARHAALTHPIVVHFDPAQDGLDQALGQELANYTPAVATAAERLEQFQADQKQLEEAAAAAAKERAAKATAKTAKVADKSKDKGKGKEVKKAAKDSGSQTGASNEAGGGDLFSAAVPEVDLNTDGTTPEPTDADEQADDAAEGDAP